MIPFVDVAMLCSQSDSGDPTTTGMFTVYELCSKVVLEENICLITYEINIFHGELMFIIYN